MFDTRLRLMLGTMALALVVIVLRLGQLQIVQADYYRERAGRSMLLKPKTLPFVRGRILDRTGRVLVQDEPCWDINLDYAIIAAAVGDWQDEFDTALRRVRATGRYSDASSDTEAAEKFRQDLSSMWSDLALFLVGRQMTTVDEMRGRARVIYERIARVHSAVAARRGFDAPVAEELRSHPLVPRLAAGQHIAARVQFKRYPWLHVEPSSVRRVLGDGMPIAHVIGRLGRVDASHVANDPNSDDPFSRYRADEKLGVMGVEYSAERRLRGRRGQVTEDRSGGVVIDETFEAQDGRDVVLTLHAVLQERLFHLLRSVVEEHPDSPGGAIVVLDVASREVLAIVSYPSFDPNRFRETFASLRDDTDRLPLRFRAVSNRYAPGSTIKPLTCLAGLMGGQTTLTSRDVCTGYLFEDVRDAWRCWQVHGTSQRKAHGSIDVVDALTGSCNVFMYRLGERIGVDRLCSTFDMVGIGRLSGIGLREEVRGINPTPGWLMLHKNARATHGSARQFAIGQGELAMTPVQVANLMATYASGRFRPVTLLRTETPTPEWRIPATPEQWLAIRRGIYGVVNDPDGTAYQFARFEHERYALCGKTGSATAIRWPTSYRIPYIDEEGVSQVAIVHAGAKRPALERFTADFPRATFDPSQVSVASKWPPHAPPPNEKFSHAWFGGFLQELDMSGQPDWSREPRVAFAALVEFGGSGGRTTGPLVKRIATELVDVFGDDLEFGNAAARSTP